MSTVRRVRTIGRGRRPTILFATAVITLAVLLLGASGARAGEWMQVSCINPDGSVAPSIGWTGGGNFNGTDSGTVTHCTTADPLAAALSIAQDPAVGDYEDLIYTPPSGSTLIGGTVKVTLGAPGSGTGAYGAVQAWEPSASPGTGASGFYECTQGQTCPGTGGSTSAFTGTISLPADEGGVLTLSAECDGTAGDGCTGVTPDTQAVFALVYVNSADLLLGNSSIPTGTGFTGTALGTVSGTGQLVFTAADPGGPGVYNVTVSVDGTPVYDAMPDSNNGQCTPVGTDPKTGALMFDIAQPCPVSAAVTASVPTASLTNGTHTLTATVTDAAGNTATVLSQQITVANPVTAPTAPTAPSAPSTPAPTTTKPTKLRDKAVFRWDFRHPVTRLKSVALERHAHLPAKAKLSVSCTPVKDCPKPFTPRSVGAKHVEKLFNALEGRRFRPGAIFTLTIAAPHREAERLIFRLRRERSPKGHVAYGIAKHR